MADEQTRRPPTYVQDHSVAETFAELGAGGFVRRGELPHRARGDPHGPRRERRPHWPRRILPPASCCRCSRSTISSRRSTARWPSSRSRACSARAAQPAPAARRRARLTPSRQRSASPRPRGAIKMWHFLRPSRHQARRPNCVGRQGKWRPRDEHYARRDRGLCTRGQGTDVSEDMMWPAHWRAPDGRPAFSRRPLSPAFLASAQFRFGRVGCGLRGSGCAQSRFQQFGHPSSVL